MPELLLARKLHIAFPERGHRTGPANLRISQGARADPAPSPRTRRRRGKRQMPLRHHEGEWQLQVYAVRGRSRMRGHVVAPGYFRGRARETSARPGSSYLIRISGNFWTRVSPVSGRGSIAGSSYRAGVAGAQPTAQSERIK